MSTSKRLLATAIPSALVGGVVAAAVLLVGDVGDTNVTRTVVQQAPIATRAVGAPGAGLTARDIYRRGAPGVVNVQANIVRETVSPFDLFPQQERGVASGSGFVVDDEGHVVTNAHVVEGAADVSVQFEDDETVDAEIIGRDTSTDLALLRVDPDEVELRPLRLGESDTVQVGDPTIAIGNPFGLDRTLTTGVVSALQRRIEAPNGFSISDVIQTDAAINPGNSGGPLLDAAGRVIGINSQIATGDAGGGNVGIAFAVPINTAKDVIPQLKDEGRVSRAFLGITGLTIDETLERLNLAAEQGVLVQAVTDGSPADEAGLRGGDTQATLDGQEIALGGDVIVGIDGREITSMDQVVDIVNSKDVGDELELTILRDGERETLSVELAQRPERAPVG